MHRIPLLILGIGLWGCVTDEGSAQGADGSGGGGASLRYSEDYVTPFVEATCGVYERCLGPALETFFQGGCHRVMREFMLYRQPALEAQLVETGEVVYHSERVAPCLEALSALSCADLGAPMPGCEEIFEGQVPEGGACEIDGACAAGLYCEEGSFDDACAGTCAALIASGAACQPGDRCVGDHSCVDGVCHPASSEGEPCGEDGPRCGSFLTCKTSEGQGGGRCVSITSQFAAEEGEPCDPMRQSFCGAGLSCGVDRESGEARCVPPAEANGACLAAIPEQCPEGQYCDLQDRSCRDLPELGAPCAETFMGEVCAGEARCVRGSCVTLKELDAPCEDNRECYSDLCHEGACIPYRLCLD